MFIILPFAIRITKKVQFRQTARDDSPESHQKKTGTPTMGGFWFAIPLLAFLFFAPHVSDATRFIIAGTLCFGAIGFADDFIKVIRKHNLGLTSKQKFFCQLFAVVALYVYAIPLELPSTIKLFSHTWDLQWAYPIFFCLLFIGTSNATNLTDGLDGLLSGLSIPVFFTFAIISIQLDQLDMAALAFVWIGLLFGFLLFNFYPAKLFMGDVGSLAIGSSIAAFSIMTKTEMLLLLLGGVFVIETLSVILQVLYFKRTQKRLFLMTPIHHTFELKGWSEPAIAVSFWLTGIFCAALTLFLFLY